MQPIAIKVELQGSELDYPDHVIITFDDALIRRIAAARIVLGLGALGAVPEVRISLDDSGEFKDDEGQPFYPEDDDGEPEGRFMVSSGWLTVGEHSILVQYWEEYCEDELDGEVEVSDALRDAIEAVMPDMRSVLRSKLAALA